MTTNIMMSATQVLEYAFATGEYLPSGVITNDMIAAAQSRYITPIIGEAMVEAICKDNYPTLLDEYIYPTLGLLSRLEADLDSYPPTQTQRERAQLFLSNLSDHLNDNEELYDEYDKDENIKNRCVMGGGIIMTRGYGKRTK